MKIAIIGDALDYQYAGIYYYTKELIKALAAIDKKNEYWIVRSKSEGAISQNVKELIIPTPAFLGAAAYRLFVQVPNALTQKGVDIVVEPRHFGPFNLPDNIKRVTVIHDLSPIHFPQWHQFLSRKLQQLFLPSILKRADQVITNSNFTKRDVIKHFPFTKEKITSIHLGKEALFKPSPDPPILKKYGIQQPYLLHTGTIEPRKNLGLLLKAFEIIKSQSFSPLQLVLVGKKGWKSDSFFQKIQNSPYKKDIKVVGYINRYHLPALYSSAELFIYPSHFEGFGLPVLEAMACGVPVIVSNVSSLPEIIGKAGLRFSPNNIQELVIQTKEVLENKEIRAHFSKYSLEQARKFSWEKTAEATLEVFEKLMTS